MNICIYGAASRTIDQKYIAAIESLGEYLAKRGHGLVFGGGANGAMGAAARGFDKGGAKDIVCIAPKFFNADGILYDRCSEYIRPDTMRERKKLLEERSDAFLITPGGIGTLDEFFEIITLRSLGQHSKPVALYNACGFYSSLVSVLREYEEQGFMKKTEELFFFSDDAEKIAEYLENTAAKTFDVHDFKNV